MTKFKNQEPPGQFKLGTKHPWMLGMQVCLNEGTRSFPRGHNYEIGKTTLKFFLNFFFRTTRPVTALL